MKAAADWGTLTHSRVGRLKVAMTGVPSACDSDKQQAVAKDWGTLLCCKSLQVLAEAGAGVWGVVAPPAACHSTLAPPFLGRPGFL